MKLLAVLLYLVINVEGQVQVRLSGNGANSSQGRVEIFYNGSWGTICNDQFDVNDAGIVCKMLGYSHGGAVVSVHAFGPGTGRIWMDNLNCDGSELTIDQCQFNGWGIANCNHTEDVGVICLYPTQPQADNCPPNNLPPQEGDVRLVGPTNRTGMGFVQVYYNNAWGAVCDDLWDVQDAKVVCRMLCFSTENAHTGTPSLLNYVRPNVSSRFVLDDVECIGNESELSHCKHKPWGDTNCFEDREYAIVSCDIDKSRPKAPDVNVTCDNGQITAMFDRQIQPYLQEHHLSVFNTSTEICNVRKNRTTNYISISIPFEQCGTNVTTNATHIFYANTLLYDYPRNSGDVIRINTYRIELYCIFPRNSSHYRSMVPLTEEIKKIATGEFRITMDFYKNYSFATAYEKYPVNVTPGQWLNVALTLNEYNMDLKIVVPDCIATPTTSDTHLINYPLFFNKCQRYTDIDFFPLNTTSYGFRYKTFKFPNYEEVYIHCKAIVCLIEEKDIQCDRSCDQTADRRRRRSVSSRFIYHISSPPIHFYSKEEEMGSQSADHISSIPVQETTSLTMSGSPLLSTIQVSLNTSSEQRRTSITSQKPTSSSVVSTAESTTTAKPSSSSLYWSPSTKTSKHLTTTDRTSTFISNIMTTVEAPILSTTQEQSFKTSSKQSTTTSISQNSTMAKIFDPDSSTDSKFLSEQNQTKTTHFSSKWTTTAGSTTTTSAKQPRIKGISPGSTSSISLSSVMAAESIPSTTLPALNSSLNTSISTDLNRPTQVATEHKQTTKIELTTIELTTPNPSTPSTIHKLSFKSSSKQPTTTSTFQRPTTTLATVSTIESRFLSDRNQTKKTHTSTKLTTTTVPTTLNTASSFTTSSKQPSIRDTYPISSIPIFSSSVIKSESTPSPTLPTLYSSGNTYVSTHLRQSTRVSTQRKQTTKKKLTVDEMTTQQPITPSTTQELQLKSSSKQSTSTSASPVSTGKSTLHPTLTVLFPSPTNSASATSTPTTSPYITKRHHTTKTNLNDKEAMSSKVQSNSSTSITVPKLTSRKLSVPTSETKSYTTTVDWLLVHKLKTTKVSLDIASKKTVKNGESSDRNLIHSEEILGVQPHSSCSKINTSYLYCVIQFMFTIVLTLFVFDH